LGAVDLLLVGHVDDQVLGQPPFGVLDFTGHVGDQREQRSFIGLAEGFKRINPNDSHAAMLSTDEVACYWPARRKVSPASHRLLSLPGRSALGCARLVNASAYKYAGSMDTVYGLIALAAILGAVGLLIGLVVGAAIVRWADGSRRLGRWSAVVLAALVLAVGIQQITAIRTEPLNAADAKAHDYSLAPLWVALGVWGTAINTVGAVVGVHLALRRHSPRPQHPSEPVEPLRL
jgi:hypothetical protein